MSTRPYFCPLDDVMDRKQSAFTLVEVLVLIAAVALLLAMILPTLANLRQNMHSTACAANLRQVTLAGLTFLGDHNNHVQPASAHHWAQAYDTSQRRWSYDRDGQLNDWASALLPYLGEIAGETFRSSPSQARPDFYCPRDATLQQANPGHALLHGESFGRPLSRVSFGVNYDLAGLLRNPDNPDAGGAFEYPPLSTTIRVHGNEHQTPLETNLVGVSRPALTMLYAEAGTAKSQSADALPPLRRNNALYYTTATGGTPARGSLADVDNHPSRIGDRIPLDRHRQSINIAFVDGRVETVARTDFDRVRISPHDP
ncbi:hypothetical protein ACERK3_05640 [Phycisphaerales bacterium AB-hyl4]|uniref:Prepilin-type N-terminal cleavage/methylation domain-containing protein n=1 Tax=Natronomicrosphaera hydrolytica TaxID=3242702 RepID=A0ABV4U5N4_9BACT